jgi:tetratricopeptide (TPR) repeat protein
VGSEGRPDDGAARGSGVGLTIPAPQFASEKRSALVIATSAYEDETLQRLRSPATDARELARVLGDPEIGGFDVTVLPDQGAHELRLGVEDFLHDRALDEVVLLYLSCHGVLDARGRLYFAASNTRKDRLASTGVESAWLMDLFDECRARRQVLILDCCFSGAFARGAKSGDGGLRLEQRLAGPGRGRVVLTASRAGEYSFEGDPLPGGGEHGEEGGPSPSVFTAGLIDGLVTGAADTDRDGMVSVEDAYDHAFAHVQARNSRQNPQRWVYGAEGRIWLARSPAGRVIVPAGLSPHVRSALDNPIPHVRAGAVQHLAEWLRSGDPAQELAARRELEHLAEQDVPLVAKTARQALEDAGQNGSQPSPLPSPGPVPAKREPGQVSEAAEKLAQRGDRHRLDGRMGEALADLNDALEISPGYAWALARRGEVHRAAGRYDEALADLNRADQLEPDTAFTLASRGDTHRLLSQYDEAMRDLNRALELDPEYSWALARRGEVHRAAGRYDEALADLNRADQLEPDTAFTHASRGDTHRLLGQYDEALRDLNRALELDPEYSWALAHRGEVHRLMGHSREARADLYRALALDPDNDWARNRLDEVR